MEHFKCRRYLNDSENVIILSGITLTVGLLIGMINSEYTHIALLIKFFVSTIFLVWILLDCVAMIKQKCLLYLRTETLLLGVTLGTSNIIYNLAFNSQVIPGFDFIYTMFLAVILIGVHLRVYVFDDIRQHVEELKSKIIAASSTKQEARKAWTVMASNILQLRKKNRGILS